jgi:hypothetical protein
VGPKIDGGRFASAEALPRSFATADIQFLATPIGIKAA